MRCELGHDVHDKTVVVPVLLRGKRFHDFASFPPHAWRSFSFEVFDYAVYATDVAGFCPGRDGHFSAVIEQQVWESWETRLACDIFDLPGRSVVLDFGASAGWYAILAAQSGHTVHAYEAVPETCWLLSRNVECNRLWDRVTIHDHWVDQRTKIPDFDSVRLLKADVEGMEFEVLEACKHLIDERKVEYMLLEISPCFRLGYDRLLQDLIERGYNIYGIPDKTHPALDRFSEDPLAVTFEMPIEDPYAFVAAIRQANVLAVRQ